MSHIAHRISIATLVIFMGQLLVASLAHAQTTTGLPQGTTLKAGTTLTCAQAGTIYNTSASCRSACSSGELDVTQGVQQAMSAIPGLTIDAQLCTSGQRCCMVPTAEITAALASGSFPAPDMAKLLLMIGNQSRDDLRTAPPARASGNYGLRNPLGATSVPVIIGRVVSWLGGFAGSLFFLYLLWGGFEWMTAGGDGKRVKSAQNKIVAAASGIVVILISYMAVAAIIGIVPG